MSTSRPFVSTSLTFIALTLGTAAWVTATSLADSLREAAAPYPNADRIVWIGQATRDDPNIGVSFPAMMRWKGERDVFAGVALYSPHTMQLREGSIVRAIRGALVSGQFFQVLGARAEAGHLLGEHDDIQGSPCEVVLSSAAWTRLGRSGGAPIGRPVQIDGESCALAGVVSSSFHFPDEAIEAWVSMTSAMAPALSIDGPGIAWCIGLLQPGVSHSRAEARLRAVEARQAASISPSLERSLFLRSFASQLTRDVAPRVRLLLALAALMLILAAANVLGSSISRGLRVRQGVLIRRVLGASERELTATFAIPSLVTALAGTGFGWLLAAVSIRASAALAGQQVPEFAGSRFGILSLASAVVVPLVLAAASTAAQVVVCRSTNLSWSLSDGSARLAGSRAYARLRPPLLIVQIALTILITGSAAVLAKGLFRLSHEELGLDTSNVHVFEVFLPTRVVADPRDAEELSVTKRTMLARLQASPGVPAAAISNEVPTSGSLLTGMIETPRGDTLRANVLTVSGTYFQTLHIPLLRGDSFRDSDPGDDNVAVIDRTLARRVFGTDDAIGSSIRLVDFGLTLRVVGIAHDVPAVRASSGVESIVYVRYRLLPMTSFVVLSRSGLEHESVRQAVQRAVSTVRQGQPLVDRGTLQDLIDQSLLRSRFYTVLLGAFGAFAALLSVVGVSGLMALMVTTRHHEFGVRMSLGASNAAIARLVLRFGARIAALGVALGLSSAWFASRLVASLVGVRPGVDLPLVLAVAAAVAVLAVCAAVIPAWRAASIAPSEALRASS